MGCGGSKNDVKDNDNPLEFVPKDISDARPDKLRKDITALYAVYLVNRDRLKPLLAEKYGINAAIDEEREKLMPVIAQKEELYNKRQPLMERVWERDADELHKAFQKFSTDKNVLVNILCARTYWQIQAINTVYTKKYNTPLLAKIVQELTTVLGTILTGSGTGLSRLLTYRLLPQPERDAALLKDCIDSLTLDDAGLLEIICTRTNIEVKLALAHFSATYKKDFVEIFKSRSTYKNYREFMLKLLECQRDEDNTRLDIDIARQYAQELYAAGAGRTLGFDPEPFIRILANISRTQFESINDVYPNKSLIKDITAKLGGDFQLAVLTRCSDKFEYLAGRIEVALKGFSPDKETLCRILGCLSRPDCVKLKQTYARMGYKRTLEEAFRSVLRSQATYLTACLMLISEDTSITPLGSDKEIDEEELELQREADRIAATDMLQYDSAKMVHKGEEIMAAKRKRRIRLLPSLKLTSSTPAANSSALDGDAQQLGAEDQPPEEEETGNNDAPDPSADPVIQEEDRMLGVSWDGKGRFLDATKLATIYRELEKANNDCAVLLDRLPDELVALQGIYRTILRHKYESDAYVRIYQGQIRHLEQFLYNRERSMSIAKSAKY